MLDHRLGFTKECNPSVFITENHSVWMCPLNPKLSELGTFLSILRIRGDCFVYVSLVHAVSVIYIHCSLEFNFVVLICIYSFWNFTLILNVGFFDGLMHMHGSSEKKSVIIPVRSKVSFKVPLLNLYHVKLNYSFCFLCLCLHISLLSSFLALLCITSIVFLVSFLLFHGYDEI